MKLMEAADLYVTRRSATGEKFYSPAAMLRSFCRHYGNQTLTSITAAQVKEFLDGPHTGPATWRQKSGMLRVFFEYWRRRGKLKTAPMPLAAPKFTQTFVPYIYSRRELRLLLNAVPRCQQNSECLMSTMTFRTLLLFLYGTGMRVGEALRLHLADVDLDTGVVTIRGTKFYKSRLVPLGHDVHQLLRMYLATPGRWNQHYQPLFQSRLHKAVSRTLVEINFQRLRGLAGVCRSNDSSYQPRVHDLRHTFAVHRLTDWYKKGADVQSLLPALSTYLGHVDLSSTQRYLTMTPELLAEAKIAASSAMCMEGVMNDKRALGPWIRRFLMEYLPDERNLARNTQQSYRDAVRLLVVFAATKAHKKVDDLLIPDISADLLRAFLRHIEEKRKCSISSRNQRLAAIHALACFIGERCPEYLEWCAQLRTVKSKRSSRVPVSYLEKPEIDALLAAPSSATKIGSRDRTLLLFLYNSGARADEAAKVCIEDLNLHSGADSNLSSVRLSGKGGKVRVCPLWSSTTAELKHLVAGRNNKERVFLNRCAEPLTRFGVHDIVTRYARIAMTRVPEMQKKHIGPHTIRHTTATHLLRAGVDINTIRAWLGHVSINTTNIYAETDLDMKAKALGMCETKRSRPRKHWRDNPDLLPFLAQL